MHTYGSAIKKKRSIKVTDWIVLSTGGKKQKLGFMRIMAVLFVKYWCDSVTPPLSHQTHAGIFL